MFKKGAWGILCYHVLLIMLDLAGRDQLAHVEAS